MLRLCVCHYHYILGGVTVPVGSRSAPGGFHVGSRSTPGGLPVGSRPAPSGPPVGRVVRFPQSGSRSGHWSGFPGRAPGRDTGRASPVGLPACTRSAHWPTAGATGTRPGGPRRGEGERTAGADRGGERTGSWPGWPAGSPTGGVIVPDNGAHGSGAWGSR